MSDDIGYSNPQAYDEARLARARRRVWRERLSNPQVHPIFDQDGDSLALILGLDATDLTVEAKVEGFDPTLTAEDLRDLAALAAALAEVLEARKVRIS